MTSYLISKGSENKHWSLTTKLGLQEYFGRADQNSKEWNVANSSAFNSTDTEMSAILYTSDIFHRNHQLLNNCEIFFLEFLIYFYLNRVLAFK